MQEQIIELPKEIQKDFEEIIHTLELLRNFELNLREKGNDTSQTT